MRKGTGNDRKVKIDGAKYTESGWRGPEQKAHTGEMRGWSADSSSRDAANGVMAYVLTREGWLLCAAAGFIETLAACCGFQIDLQQVPLSAFLVLWTCFGIMTSALLMMSAWIRDRRLAAMLSAPAGSRAVPDGVQPFYTCETQRKVS